ncbi:hypothetical protein [Burkholderia ambifaria]|nr:hypothetical protein [Burkholderia ambifaria]
MTRSLSHQRRIVRSRITADAACVAFVRMFPSLLATPIKTAA